jgi:hypothetical protein
MYIVISKPKRRSVAAGGVQFIVISSRDWLRVYGKRLFES